MDADAIFTRSQELRAAIAAASEAGDNAEVARLEHELTDLRATAARASFDVATGLDELLRLRHELRELVQANKASRTDYIGTGSPERQRFVWPELSNRPFFADDYERIVRRIRELETGLVAADAMGDIPILDSSNETRWW